MTFFHSSGYSFCCLVGTEDGALGQGGKKDSWQDANRGIPVASAGADRTWRGGSPDGVQR